MNIEKPYSLTDKLPIPRLPGIGAVRDNSGINSIPLVVRSEAIKQIVADLADEIAHIIDTRTRTCCNCIQFTSKEMCLKAKPPQRPPANIIVKGCELWEEDDIPF